jgi:hypothetical protein
MVKTAFRNLRGGSVVIGGAAVGGHFNRLSCLVSCLVLRGRVNRILIGKEAA